MRRLFLTFVFLVGLVAELSAATFQNPIISSGADPWIIQRNGYYYYTHTTGGNVRVRKSTTLTGSTGLGNASPATVFTPSAPNNKNVWAPELHFLQGRWYIYFAADDGDNANHRMYVAQSNTGDPQGSYTFKGKIYDPSSDRWAIDGTVLEMDDGSLYFIWSGWPGTENVVQNLYIAPMSNPWTISGPRVLISTPTYSWEWWLNEGPQVIKRNGKIFIVYSANGSWTDNYCFGLLTCTNGNVLDPNSWKKNANPIFKKTTSGSGVYGPGHGSFTKSVDGKEDWLIYHAAKASGTGWDRNVRLQKFTWNANDSPNFGTPIPTNVPVIVPSGEGANLLSVTWNPGGFVTRSPNQLSYPQNSTVTLTAVPLPGSFFGGWQGSATGFSNPLTVTMDTNKTIRAVFTNEVILDNSAAIFSGDWSTGTSATTKFGNNYRFANVSNSVTHTATYVPDFSSTAKYDVYVWYPEGANRSVATPHVISHLNGTHTTNINQQINGGTWNLIAAGLQFEQGTNGFVQIRNNGGNIAQVVMADAVRFVYSTNQDLPPKITAHPEPVTIPRGSNATFNVTVSGTAPFQFQWRFNGTNIPGATANIFSRTNVQGKDAGVYSVFVSNNEGSATSSNAVLTVQLPLEFHTAALDENGELRLVISGTYGSTNRIETSTNLIDWIDLTNVVMTSSELEFTNPGTNGPQRFFRVIPEP